jgi:parvulin-like peptidyl-prolyl isomerase
MATKSSENSKTAAPKNAKSSMSFSSLRKNIAKRYSKTPTVYKGVFVAAVVVIALGVLLWFHKGLVVAGNINGQIITTPSFYNRLVKADGSQVFDSLVQETLIKQEARKKNVTASKDEIDKKIAEIETNLGDKEGLDSALAQNNTTMDQLRTQVEIQILVEKLLADQIKVTDAEVTKYIADNKATSPNITRDQATQQVQSEKLSEKFTPWYNDLKAKAKIYKFF